MGYMLGLYFEQKVVCFFFFFPLLYWHPFVHYLSVSLTVLNSHSVLLVCFALSFLFDFLPEIINWACYYNLTICSMWSHFFKLTIG